MKKYKKPLLASLLTITLIPMVSFSPASKETFTYSKIVSSSSETSWEVISDVANYHRYATGLDEVFVVSGKEEGMIRSCSDERGVWRETCTLWEEGRSYSFEVDTKSGFPYPFTYMKGTWSVHVIDDHFSEITVRFDYEMSYKWMSWIFSDATNEAFQTGTRELLNNWEKEIVSK